MADTKVLRRRIEEQIRLLQEKLRAIELVEEMSREIGRNEDKPSISVSTDSTMRDMSVAEACKNLLFESGKAWTVTSVWDEVKKRGKHGATREAVSVALRRLAAADVISAQKASNGKVKYMARSQIAKAHLE